MSKTYREKEKRTKRRQYYDRKDKKRFKNTLRSKKWQSMEDFCEDNLDILGEYCEM